MTKDPLASLAARLGMPSGGLYTLVIGYVLVLGLTLTGPTAAFSNRNVAVPTNRGLGDLAVAPVAAPSPTTTIAPPSTAPPVTTAFAPLPVPSTTQPSAPTTTAPAPAPPVVADQPAGPEAGDLVADAAIPGRVTAVTAVAGGALVAVDRDDADPLVVRLGLDGEEIGSVVITGRDLSADVDIVDLDVDAFGRAVVLVNGPAEVLLIDGDDITSAGVLADLPPCAVPLPVAVPVACEPGAEDHPIVTDSVAATGDRVVVSDPGQGVLWSIDADGAVRAAHIDEADRQDEESLGLRGIVSMPGGTVLGTRHDALVEFTFGEGEVTSEPVRSLDSPAVALARGDRNDIAVVGDAGSITRYDRSLSVIDEPAALRTISDPDISDVAVSVDGLWVTRPRSAATSDVTRYLLEESAS